MKRDRGLIVERSVRRLRKSIRYASIAFGERFNSLLLPLEMSVRLYPYE